MNKCLLSSNKDDWETPDKLFHYLDNIFHFTLDPCSNGSNYKCQTYYTYKNYDDNGLVNSWEGHIVFCNPPYGKCIIEWIKKGYYESIYNDVLSCFLIPARTDTDWFHNYILGSADIYFLRGRIKFKGAKYFAPFPSMLVIFSRCKHHFIDTLDIKEYCI